MELSEKIIVIKNEITFLQNQLNNSINKTDGTLGNDEFILKTSMELDELINLYMKLIFNENHKNY